MPLLPFGVVERDGKETPAKLIAGHADIGDQVVITGNGSFGLIVKAIKEANSN